MYLKSLTLRGFKSFASATTLHLEPGITCVVGPNGSGKSNVVDALAWVMGEQGAKSLRGGKMEDVIFAGTAGRAPLGRAEVVLTIDNSDGKLPIDYSEVTISRTMFRSGGSEYAINGTTCRLLDVSELLADSGIGREMHVIVGQGQLDAILHATPEERRGFVEEAAGVVKHRRRREKALRKLDLTEQNLNRLADLLTEIRRQLKPLGRQAEVARRASAFQMELRDAKARLLADDLLAMRAVHQRELADEEALRAMRAELEQASAADRTAQESLERQLSADAAELTAAQEAWFGLTAVRERLCGTARVAQERVRHGREEPSDGGERATRDPDELETESSLAREQEHAVADQVAGLRQTLAEALRERAETEEAHLGEERRVAGLVRAAADRREGLARLTGSVQAFRSRAAAADEEIARLESARGEAAERACRAQRGFTSLETRIAGLDAGESGLDAEHEGAMLRLGDIDARLTKLRAALQEAQRDRAALSARAEALAAGMRPKDASAALLSASASLPGVLGSLASVVSIRPGSEAAVAAALGAASDGVVVADVDAAVAAIELLKAGDHGRAELVLGGAVDADAGWPALPDEARWARDLVDGPASIRPAISRLLHLTAVVADLAAARTLVGSLPTVVAVTRDGDVVAGHVASGGSSRRSSALEAQAALDRTRESLDEATGQSERLQFELSSLDNDRAETQARADVTLARLHESDASMAAVAEELGQLGGLARSAKAEAARLAAAITAAEESRDEDLSGLADLEERLRRARSSPAAEPETSALDGLAAQARAARQSEMDTRLALRTAEERARALHERAESLTQAAARERGEREQARLRRQRRFREAAVAAAVATGVATVLSRLEPVRERAAERRTRLASATVTTEATLVEIRERLRSVDAELARLTDTVHRDELVRAEQRIRLEQLEQRVADELGLDVETLIAEYGPNQPVPATSGPGAESDTDAAGTDEQRWVPYVRVEQERRLRRAERALTELGRINPLALEEFSALEERHQFLADQLEDLRRTRRDLLDIVREVDERIERVFTETFADVAREFGTVFGRLFPGGDGRLVLTAPGDMLASGVDVEARPAGKSVKRLSLLSGGERSLVAVAFLVALFKARPSPFYILDEVEAALDDTNLGRLLELYEELRAQSQLVVITHQKRTMECADALYGITMRGDGVSSVISQRLREAVA
ncbi:MAG: chromosome segregation protein SMC [Nocardioidaceae bacterium]